MQTVRYEPTTTAAPSPDASALAQTLATGDLGTRLVRLAQLAAALHRTQAAGLIASVRAHEAGAEGAR